MPKLTGEVPFQQLVEAAIQENIPAVPHNDEKSVKLETSLIIGPHLFCNEKVGSPINSPFKSIGPPTPGFGTEIRTVLGEAELSSNTPSKYKFAIIILQIVLRYYT